MRALIAVLLLTGCASSGVDVPTQPERPRMRVTVENHYRDPVDVSIYCGGKRVGKASWLMRESRETVRVRIDIGCVFRFTIIPSITGGPYTYTPRFDSRRDYEDMKHEPQVCVTVGSLVTNSSALQGACR